MSILAYDKFKASIVRPYITIPCLVICKTTMLKAYAGDMYDSHDYVCCTPLSRLLRHTNSSVAFKGTVTAITEPFIIGQYHNSTIDMMAPQEPSHDILTDILSGLYWSLCNELPELSYVYMQAYYLIARISQDTPPMFGGKETRYEVKTYEF